MEIKKITLILIVILFQLFAFDKVTQASKPHNLQKKIVAGASLKDYKQPKSKHCDINVPSQFTTLQDAVSAASSGDTICVRAGNYNENVLIDKSIRLSGAGYKKSIIKGQIGGRTVSVTASSVIVEGFLIIGAGPDYANAAVHLAEFVSETTIRYNKLVAGSGGLAFLTDNAQHDNIIQNNILEGSNSPYVARVGQFDNSKPSDKVDFINNTFIGTVNPTSLSDTGITLNAGAPNSSVKRNVFNTTGTMIVLIASTINNSINENNFNSNTTIKVGGTIPINAENNWWGDTDPSDNAQSGVDFTPFATKPFKENK